MNYPNEEKQDFITKVSEVSAKTNIPFSVCMAFKGDIAKIELLQEVLTVYLTKDLEDEHSFILDTFSKHINIDSVTGRVVDLGIPYHYKNELLTIGRRQDYALAKVLFGLTGSTSIYERLEISRMSNKSIGVIAQYVYDKLKNALQYQQLHMAVSSLDSLNFNNLTKGTFYVSKEEKHIKDLRGITFFNPKTVIIPRGITVIKSYAFENTGIEKVSLPGTLSHIEDGAFMNCNLKNVKIPSNKYLKALGSQAFAFNQIEEITIPENIKELDMRVFTGNPLKTVTVNKTTRIYNVPDSVSIQIN